MASSLFIFIILSLSLSLSLSAPSLASPTPPPPVLANSSTTIPSVPNVSWYRALQNALWSFLCPSQSPVQEPLPADHDNVHNEATLPAIDVQFSDDSWKTASDQPFSPSPASSDGDQDWRKNVRLGAKRAKTGPLPSKVRPEVEAPEKVLPASSYDLRPRRSPTGESTSKSGLKQTSLSEIESSDSKDEDWEIRSGAKRASIRRAKAKIGPLPSTNRKEEGQSSVGASPMPLNRPPQLVIPTASSSIHEDLFGDVPRRRRSLRVRRAAPANVIRFLQSFVDPRVPKKPRTPRVPI